MWWSSSPSSFGGLKVWSRISYSPGTFRRSEMVWQTHQCTLMSFFAICQIANGSFFLWPSVRMLLQPKGSRSHVHVSNITKRSFLTSSNSADTLAVSPGPELKYYPISMCTHTNMVIYIYIQAVLFGLYHCKLSPHFALPLFSTLHYNINLSVSPLQP